MVQRYLQQAASDWQGKPRMLIVPHAGYIYSGWVAAYAYNLLKGRKITTVVMIGPAHYPTSHHGYSMYVDGAFETPLGRVSIDSSLAQKLLDDDADFADRPESHRLEHCLEVQMPFLQEMLTDFRIVPILMRDQGMHRCRRLAEALADVWFDELLLVASTDLSHYHPKKVAALLDEKVERYIEAVDPDGLQNAIASGEAEMCGGGPAVVALLAAKKLGFTEARVLRRADSSDSPDGHAGPAEVVGYLSAVIG